MEPALRAPALETVIRELRGRHDRARDRAETASRALRLLDQRLFALLNAPLLAAPRGDTTSARILNFLRWAKEVAPDAVFGPTEIAATTRCGVVTVRQTLQRMVLRGQLEHDSYGEYRLAATPTPASEPHVTLQD